MLKRMAIVVLALGMSSYLSAQGSDFLVRFDGGIGVIPVSNGTGTENPTGVFSEVTRNTVRGIKPAGGNWRIGELKVDVSRDGHIEVKGRGLLLASGNSIGQNANQAVFATLSCEVGGPLFSTSFSVPLEPNGDFRISDTLASLPSTCASPVLLVRSASGDGPWFAAGIRKFADN